MSDPIFCANCGRKVEGGSVYCPECGKAVDGSDSRAPEHSSSGGSMSGRLIAVAIMMALLALIALVSGFSLVSSLDAMMDSLVKSSDWANIVQTFYDNFQWTADQTYDFIRSTFSWLGYYFIVVGVLSAIGFLCTITRKQWTIGLLMYIITTLMMTVTILGLIIGIVVTYLYYKSKPEFC